MGQNCHVGGGVRWLLQTPAYQGYIAKFDANGEYVFDRAIGGRGDSVEVMDLKTAAVGSYTGTMRFAARMTPRAISTAAATSACTRSTARSAGWASWAIG